MKLRDSSRGRGKTGVCRSYRIPDYSAILSAAAFCGKHVENIIVEGNEGRIILAQNQSLAQAERNTVPRFKIQSGMFTLTERIPR